MSVFTSKDERVAWAAGLFEGEGTITVCNGRPRVAVKSTDEDVVRRIRDALGVGFVGGPYQSSQLKADGGLRLPFWFWIAEVEEGREALEAMLSWLGQRRAARARQVFGIAEPAVPA